MILCSYLFTSNTKAILYELLDTCMLARSGQQYKQRKLDVML